MSDDHQKPPVDPTVALGPPTRPPQDAAPQDAAPQDATMMLGAPQAPGIAPAPAPRAAPVTDAEQFIGRELCGYTIQRKLAEGGMGVVFEGVHAKIGRRGAIKLLKVEYCRSDEVIERFYQEARAVNAIRHENIVDIYDFGRDDDGRAFYVMEFLEGEALSARVHRGALSWNEAYPILSQTLRALKAAHDKGVVHRDLKPDNIWLKHTDAGVQVKLLDFGIAKLVGADSPQEKLTQAGTMIGTPHYMSPEQINGSKNIDHRSDIYAMGVIMYELFAGVTPFRGDTLQAILTGHLLKEPPKLADIPANLGVPLPLAAVIDRMLAKTAAARYTSVAEVLADLRDVSEERLPGHAERLASAQTIHAGVAAPAPATEAPPDAPALAAPAPRGKGLWIGLGAAVLLAGGGAAAWKLTRPTAPPVVAVAPTPAPAPTPTPTPTPAPTPAPAEIALDHDQIRTDARTTLRTSLDEAEPRVRVQGADALGKIKDAPSIPALTRLTEADPDLEVRGHAADALGALEASTATALLTRLEKGAPAELKVWYASALARLGDKGARKRLLAQTKDKNLAVAFRAGLTVADISLPGDKDAIKALRVLASREADLNAIAPYAGAVILTKLAALRDPDARKILYSILEATDEGSRLAAAEGLARLGDDGGKKVLQDVLASDSSPNRLVGAVALIPLGEYGGFDLITSKLDDKDDDTRRMAATALGDIGERKSLRPLIALLSDKSWPVRISAAAALIAIVGLDPQVLAQASVDWTKGALASDDWAVRKAAAGVLGDMPETQAVPLLAQAIADTEPKVRLAAARSAGKMKSAEASTAVAAAAMLEKDPAVKEQQVKALGEIGHAAAHDTLVEIASDKGRIGVFAAGSLIAIGDTSGKARLDEAVADRRPDIRLAAVEAASAADNAVVVPTLKVAIVDKVFDVRFTAAEGLSRYGAEKAAAVPVLETGLTSKDPGVFGRAQVALLALGERRAGPLTPAEMLDAPAAAVRLAAVPLVAALPNSEGVPLLRRIVADSDEDVRRAGVDAIEQVASRDKDQAIRLYKKLVNDDDPVVRAKAAGQLSRLVEAPPKTAAAPPTPTPAPDPTPVPDPVPTPTPTPAGDPALAAVQVAASEATTTAAEATAALDKLTALTTEITTTIAQPTDDDAVARRVDKLAEGLDAALTAAEAATAKLEAQAQAVAKAAGASPSPAAAALVAEAQAAATSARTRTDAAKATGATTTKKARAFAKDETTDPQLFLAAADASLASGNLAQAKRELDKAAAVLRASGTKDAGLDFSYAQLYDKLAAREKDPAGKKKLLEQAQDAYQRFARGGSGARVQRANARLGEITEELAELAAGTP